MIVDIFKITLRYPSSLHLIREEEANTGAPELAFKARALEPELCIHRMANALH